MKVHVHSHTIVVSEMAQACIRDFFRHEFPNHTTDAFIWVDSNESGSEMSLWLRPIYKSTGGTRLTMPGTVVLVPCFYEVSLTPDYHNIHHSVYHRLCTSVEVVDEISKSVALRRKLSDRILARARELEEMARSLEGGR